MHKYNLTPRQEDVFKYLCKGCTNKEIGIALHIKDRTVESHISEIYRKLDVTNKTEAVTQILNKQNTLIHLLSQLIF